MKGLKNMDTILKWFNWGFKPIEKTPFEEKIEELNNRIRKINEEINEDLMKREYEGISAYFYKQNEDLVKTKEDHWLIG
ncbi:TPA: hypothetical protein NR883_002748 [Listeria innocua]|nr:MULTISPECIES: hypothetical protein [Listeria]EHF2870088.1 hypothetical protein [Listeria monocytogenes]EHG1764014.1 hypothetical protein [Listeria monocytogenes]EIZ2731135.1 hypothetical protein [Listeria monocytogenes]EIZ2736905.1 hypothetical protein [Listeria monocytogenes]EIZ2931992.1 hypothetical protein [Listeria monocytogenes]